MIKKQTKKNIKFLKRDNGLKFYNHVFDDFYNT